MTVIPQDAEGLPVHWYIRVLSVYHVIILMQLWYQMYQCSWDAKKYQESTEINNLTLKCTFLVCSLFISVQLSWSQDHRQDVQLGMLRKNGDSAWGTPSCQILQWISTNLQG